MIGFSKKANYILIGCLLLLNIVFRYPVTPHEIGMDSFFVHGLVNSISDYGKIKWALHPLSFFGLYPLSYPSGSPVILSVASQITGVSIENTILVYGIILGILGMLGSYIMALKIKNWYLFGFFTSFAFSTAPIFLELTRWTASTRNLFVALFPLFLWSIFWFNKKNTYLRKPFLLAIIFLLTLVAAHRISFLLALVLISFVLAEIIWYIKDKPFILNCTNKLSEIARFLALITLFLFAFTLQFSGIRFYRGIWYEYQSGALSQGSSLFSLLLNLSTNYIGQVGILILIGLIGFFMLIGKNKKDFNDIFIICLLLLSASISALGTYIVPFLLPIISLLIASGLCGILKIFREDKTSKYQIIKCINFKLELNKKFPAMLLIICLLASIGFSGYILERHLHATLGDTDDETWMTREPYVGSFLKEQGARIILSNDDLISKRIYASTKVPYLDTGVNALINSWIEKNELEVQPLSLRDLSIDSDYLFSLIKRPQVEKDFSSVYTHEIQSRTSEQILNKYSVDSIVINNRIPDKMVGVDFLPYPSIFPESVTNSESRIYDNNRESIYRLW